MIGMEQARKLVASALEKAVEEVAIDGAMGEVAGWDSLGHMQIVLKLESALGRTLSPEEILRLTSVADVAALLAKHCEFLAASGEPKTKRTGEHAMRA
jgi:acyl carrier protein